MPLRDTDAVEFVANLDAGVTAEKMGHILTKMAHKVLEQGKQGKMTLSLTMAPLGSGSQVKVTHKLDYTVPTKSGKWSEDSTQETPFYVNPTGTVTLFPEDQSDMFNKNATNARENTEG